MAVIAECNTQVVERESGSVLWEGSGLKAVKTQTSKHALLNSLLWIFFPDQKLTLMYQCVCDCVSLGVPAAI